METPAPEEATVTSPLGDMDWTEKYRPKNLGEVLGNIQAVKTLRWWGSSWKKGIPQKKALILYGPPGIGKTSAALALANDMGWRTIELNASDTRNQENIKKVSGASIYESFGDDGSFTTVRDGLRTLIVFDEADNLYVRRGGEAGESEYNDKGGREEIIKTIRNTSQPIILIANDYYTLTKNSPLKQLCTSIQFRALEAQSVRRALSFICRKEGLKCDADAIDWLVRQADGDLRGALNDLQSAARVQDHITKEMVDDLGLRDTPVTIFKAVERIFRAEDPYEARQVSFKLDESPEHLLNWVDENIPLEYTKPKELLAAMEAVARADVFLGRVRRRQSYKLWSYAYDLMTMGVNVAREGPPSRRFVRYQFPSYIRRMASTKGQRRLKKLVSKQLMLHCHTSHETIGEEIMPKLSFILRQTLAPPSDRGLEDQTRFREVASFLQTLELGEKEAAFLIGLPPKDQNLLTLQALMREDEKRKKGGDMKPIPTRKAVRKAKKKAKEEKPPKEEKKEEETSKNQMSLDVWG